jgi:predicted nucleotidyltransferase component of viral defense system
MIARSHFTQIADADEVDAKTVERDYVLTHVLAAICQQPGSQRMVFKGGTALRLCYFEDYRYSADLDFSLTESMTTEQALDLVRAALLTLIGDVDFTELSLGEDGKYIVYSGPLGGRRKLKLDLADDELVEGTTTMGLLGRYPDQPDVKVCVYTLEEVAAEKLRCVMDRHDPLPSRPRLALSPSDDVDDRPGRRDGRLGGLPQLIARRAPRVVLGPAMP